MHLKSDVLFLANVFENFRNKSLKNYGLCPSCYLSAPGLKWNAICLKLNPITSLQYEKKFLMFLTDVAKATICT